MATESNDDGSCLLLVAGIVLFCDGHPILGIVCIVSGL